MRLLIEPEPELLIERFDQYLEFVERIDSPLGGAELRRRPRLLRRRRSAGLGRPDGRRTRGTITSKTSPPRACTSTSSPATGRSTSPPRSQAIAATGYDGWLTVELYPYIDSPDDAAREAREFLTDAGDRLGVTMGSIMTATAEQAARAGGSCCASATSSPPRRT